MAKETVKETKKYPTFEHRTPYFRLAVNGGAIQFLKGEFTPVNDAQYKILVEYIDNQPEELRIKTK